MTLTARRFDPAPSRRNRDGLRPTSPQHAAGMRMDPPASVPWAIGTTPAATSAAAPPEEPPGDRDGSCGLRQGGQPSGSVVTLSPTSGHALLPSITRPLSSIRAAIASVLRDTYWPVALEPHVVRTP